MSKPRFDTRRFFETPPMEWGFREIAFWFCIFWGLDWVGSIVSAFIWSLLGVSV